MTEKDGIKAVALIVVFAVSMVCHYRIGSVSKACRTAALISTLLVVGIAQAWYGFVSLKQFGLVAVLCLIGSYFISYVVSVFPLAYAWRQVIGMDDAHIAAHTHSIRHGDEIGRSDCCGCFYCCRTFPPSEIREWIDDGADESDKTALCPFCGIDSVIGSASGYPVTEEFLERMKRHWF